MGQRTDLQTKLESFLGCKNVYYEPPENVKIKYPAIVYSKDDMYRISADNRGYISYSQYTITVIDYMPDNPAIKKILEMPMASYDRHYRSNNLEHDIINIYW